MKLIHIHIQKILATALLLLTFSAINAQPLTDSTWSSNVKSVYLAPLGNELATPIIRIDNYGNVSSPLLLRFDILDPQPQHLRYRFRHCNADWTADDLDVSEFFTTSNDAPIGGYQSSFTTLIEYTNYYQQLPEQYGQFLASGNYILEVYHADHQDSIILSRRFYVTEDAVDMNAMAGKPSGPYGNIYQDQEVSVEISPKKGSSLPLQADYYHVVVQQNGRNDSKRVLPFNGYNSFGMDYSMHKENVFPAGNHFRYFDLSNLRATMYHVQRIEQIGTDILAFLQPDEDRSRKPYSQYNSLNGGMKTNIRDRNNPHIEADYVWVIFSLPMQQPMLDGNVYIAGDLTQWNLNDSCRMDWNPKYRAYTKRMLLKQGYYSYQLLFLPAGEKEAVTSRLEGDHFAMPNSYSIFVYFRMPGSRYDRLVSLSQIQAASN